MVPFLKRHDGLRWFIELFTFTARLVKLMCFNSSAAAVLFNDNADESCLVLYLDDDTFLFMGLEIIVAANIRPTHVHSPVVGTPNCSSCGPLYFLEFIFVFSDCACSVLERSCANLCAGFPPRNDDSDACDTVFGIFFMYARI